MAIPIFLHLPTACFLLVIVSQGQAEITPQQYWKSVLPNTPIPRVILEILNNKAPPSAAVITGNGNSNGAWKNMGAVDSDDSKAKRNNMTLFFHPRDLQSGSNLTLRFARPVTGAVSFLPRLAADGIPFSTAKLPEILQRFAVPPGSVAAAGMKDTLHGCETPPDNGERKHCATSLESMVDFAVARFGTNRLRASSATSFSEDVPRQQYTVNSVTKMATGRDGSVLVCHLQEYPYAVYYCHTLPETAAYVAAIAGEDGVVKEAVAVCHGDTGTGMVPICHFSMPGAVLWTDIA